LEAKLADGRNPSRIIEVTTEEIQSGKTGMGIVGGVPPRSLLRSQAEIEDPK
jgi:hypothetical protein